MPEPPINQGEQLEMPNQTPTTLEGGVPSDFKEEKPSDSINEESTEDTGPWRFPGMSKQWQEFMTCVMLHMLFPLLPLGIEKWITSTISQETLSITASMYAVSIGLSSRNKVVFGGTMTIAFIFAVMFGILQGNKVKDMDVNKVSSQVIKKGSNTITPKKKKPKDLPLGHEAAFLCLGLIFFTHSCERYNRHVADQTPFWEFE